MDGRHQVPDQRPATCAPTGARNSSCSPIRSACRCWSRPSTTASRRARPKPRCSGRSTFPDAPRYPHGANICLDGKGEPLLVRGRVTDIDGHPIKGALLDVWQANDEGFYDVQQKGMQPDMNLRGDLRNQTPTAATGSSRSSRASIPIPDDGPVGQMLAALGRHPFRPAHIHFIVGADGFKPITTHVFDPDDPYLATDAVFGVKESLIVEFREDRRSGRDRPASASTDRIGRPSATSCWPGLEAKRGKAGLPPSSLARGDQARCVVTAAARRCRSCAKMMPCVIR